MAEDMGKLREQLNDTKTQWVLSKDQLRMFEEALREVRAVKQEDDQRWRTELESCKKRIREFDESVTKKDETIE